MGELFMKIAFASGKGGTGKTTLSTNLVKILSDKFPVQFIDCDVEEPNAHLFLKPTIRHSVYMKVPVPGIDSAKCINCGKCSEFCAFKAIASLPSTTFVFPELCHSCGGCKIICPENAITESYRKIGLIERGISSGIDFIHGRLNVGETMSSPLIRKLGRYVDTDSLVLIDSPPGANCGTMSTLNIADMVVLITEPTPFGLNDLKIIVDMLKAVNKPFGVIINRSGIGNEIIEDWCNKENIPIWGRVPDDLMIAELCSNGALIVEIMPEIRELLGNIAISLLKEAGI
jgi:MinD superfamily P-loop ATPase